MVFLNVFNHAFHFSMKSSLLTILVIKSSVYYPSPVQHSVHKTVEQSSVWPRAGWAGGWPWPLCRRMGCPVLGGRPCLLGLGNPAHGGTTFVPETRLSRTRAVLQCRLLTVKAGLPCLPAGPCWVSSWHLQAQALVLRAWASEILFWFSSLR